VNPIDKIKGIINKTSTVIQKLNLNLNRNGFSMNDQLKVAMIKEAIITIEPI